MIGSSPTLIPKRRRSAGGASTTSGTGGAIVLLGSRVPAPMAANNDDDDDNDVGNNDGASIRSGSSSIDTSDDLASLQSIDDSMCTRSRNEPLEQQQQHHQQQQQQQTMLLREAERTLLTAIGTSDPTSALLEYYQSLGRGKRKNNGEDDKSNHSQPKQPTYRDIQHRDERGVITGWWRSVLHCPVMDREYPSGLPWSVWLTHACMSNADDIKGDDDACAGADWDVILTKLGESKIFDDGLVYFKSKKGARKAAAIAAYEANLLAKSRKSDDTSDSAEGSLVDTQVMFSSKAEVLGTVSSSGASSGILAGDEDESEATVKVGALSESNNIVVPTTEPTAPAEPTKRVGYAPRSHYPEWVNRLSRLGVTASSINIKFRENLPTQPEGPGIK